jgi:predicted outer membrane repeat protein
MNISSSIFSNNKATNSGGAIYSSSRLNIRSNSQFYGNYAINGGGIYSVNVLSVSSSLFNGNNVTGSGGAIFVAGGTGTISSTTFNNNLANANGGAIRSSTPLTLSSSTFNSNKANNIGGGICSSGTLVLNTGTFNNNNAKDAGGVYTSSSSRITDSKFNNNKATNNGGAISSTSTLNVTRGSFSNNGAKNGGGIFSSATLRISSSGFSKNSASANGGSIYSKSNCNITSGSISGSTAVYGSGIYSAAGTLRLNKVSLSSNYAKLINIALSTPSSAKSGTKLVIYSSVSYGDNVLNTIYTKNTNIYINNKRPSIQSKLIGKNIPLKLNTKTINEKTNKEGVATFSINAPKVSKSTTLKATVSYSQNGEKVSASNNIKITLSSVKVTRNVVYGGIKSTTTTTTTGTGSGSGGTKSGSGTNSNSSNTGFTNSTNSNSKNKDVIGAIKKGSGIYSLDILRVNAATNYKNVTIESKKISYWNIKITKATTKIVNTYFFAVNKNGWYSGTLVNGKFSWVKMNSKPSSSGIWHKLNYNSTSKTGFIGSLSNSYNSAKSNTPLYFAVALKKSFISNSLKPYIQYNYSIIEKNKKSNLYVYEQADYNIYFKNDLNTIEYNKYNLFLKKSYLCDVGDPIVKNQIIKIFSTKLNGELTSLSKSKAIFDWVGAKEKYDLYYGPSHSSIWSIKQINDPNFYNGKDLINCADHATLLNALLRTASIPAIYANGRCKFTKDTFGHYWSMAYISKIGWVWLDTIHPPNMGYKYNVVPWTLKSDTGTFIDINEVVSAKISMFSRNKSFRI